MKKSHFILIAIIATAFSCTGEMSNTANIASYNIHETNSNKRSYDEALLAANNALHNLYNGFTRSDGNKPTELLPEVKYVVDKPLVTRSTGVSVDTLMYVFNIENEQGFIIISANKNTPPLLAYTDAGYYDPAEEQDNIGFQQLIEGTKQYVKKSVNNTGIVYTSKGPIFIGEVTYLILQQVGKFINVSWGQEDPEGLYCPNGASGCVITAMAMLMSYYNSPSSISITHDGLSIPNYSLNWTQMKYHKRRHSYSSQNEHFLTQQDSINCHEMISHLCRQLGCISGSDYSNYNTLTNNDSISTTFAQCGYYCSDYIPYTQADLKSILDQGRPVFMLGYTSGNQGHAWLVDGYQYCDVYDPNVMTMNPDGSITFGAHYYRYYNHINWGWDGKNNGYFIANSFYTLGERYDYTGNNNYNYNFINNLEMLNVFPSNN